MIALVQIAARGKKLANLAVFKIANSDIRLLAVRDCGIGGCRLLKNETGIVA